MTDLDERLEAAILDLLGQRGPDKTICPSEVARRVAPDNWRPLMEPTRAAAKRLATAGEIVVTQRSRVVDVLKAKGPVRLRKIGHNSHHGC
jgi:hypothetical protein